MYIEIKSKNTMSMFSKDRYYLWNDDELIRKEKILYKKGVANEI